MHAYGGDFNANPDFSELNNNNGQLDLQSCHTSEPIHSSSSKRFFFLFQIQLPPLDQCQPYEWPCGHMSQPASRRRTQLCSASFFAPELNKEALPHLYKSRLSTTDDLTRGKHHRICTTLCMTRIFDSSVSSLAALDLTVKFGMPSFPTNHNMRRSLICGVPQVVSVR